MSLLIMQPLVDKGLEALTGVQTVCVPGITMVQLTPEQRIFVVKNYRETRSFQATQNAFAATFPYRAAPTKKTIWSNVKKYQDHGTSLASPKQGGTQGGGGLQEVKKTLQPCDSNWQNILRKKAPGGMELDCPLRRSIELPA